MTRYGQTRKQKAGTRILGKGRTGTSYYPALPCENSQEQPPGKWVSKATTSREARSEWMRTKPLREKNYDFTAHPISVCKGVGQIEKGKDRWLLFSKYAGRPISQVMDDFIENAYECLQFMKALKELRGNIIKMNNDGIFHHDTSAQNMTYNEQEQKAYLLDFGEMVANPVHNRNRTDDTIGLDQQIRYFYARLYDILGETWDTYDARLLEEALRTNTDSNRNSNGND